MAAQIGKLEVVKRLLSQNPELLTVKVGAKAHTLLHAVADTRHQHIVNF